MELIGCVAATNCITGGVSVPIIQEFSKNYPLKLVKLFKVLQLILISSSRWTYWNSKSEKAKDLRISGKDLGEGAQTKTK